MATALGHAEPPPAPPPQREFDREHLRLLTDKLSEKVNQLRMTNERQSALVDLGLQLGSEHNAGRLLESFCHAARRIIGARYALVGIPEGEGPEVRERFISGMARDSAKGLGPVQTGRNVLALVLKERRSFLVNNPGGDPGKIGFPASYPPIHSLLAAPIASLSRTFGWLCLIDKVGGETFSDEDERLAGILAAQVGRIYENGRLYHEVLRHAADLDLEMADHSRTEDQLRLQTSALTAAANGVVITDFKGNVTWVNPAFTRMTGYSAPEILGQNTRFLKSGQHHQAFYQDLWKTVLSGRIWHGEIVNRRKDGSLYFEEQTITPVTNAQGNITQFIAIKQDVSERKRAEETLRASEEKTRLIIETANDPFIAMDAGGRIIEWNHQAEAAFGWSRAEAVGRRLAQTIIPPRYQQAHERGLGNFLATGEGPVLNQRIEIEAVHRDGHEFPVELMVWPIRLNGTCTFSAFIRDITERKRAEAALLANNRRAHLSAHVGIALTSGKSLRDMLRRCAESMAHNLEAAFARIWTLNAADNVLELQASAGMYTHLDGPHSRVPVGQFKIGLIAQERQPHLTNDVCHDPRVSDKEWARRENMVAFAGYPLIVEDRLVGVMAMFSRKTVDDSTLRAMASVANQIALGIERKNAEEALRQAQQRLQHILSASPAVLYTLAVKDNSIVGVSWISANLPEMTGHTVAEAVGADWWLGNVHPEDLQDVLARVQEGIFGGGYVANEYRFRHKNGQFRWVRSEMRLLRGPQGQALEIVGSWSDITERKKLEEQFRQAQKMEAVGRLAGGVAHDFNNLLTVISGYSDMLLGSLRKEDPLWTIMEQINNAAERAAALTRQLLAFSRKQVLKPVVLDLNSLFGDMEKMLRRLIGEDIELSFCPDPELARVLADAGQLEQVLMNLIVNARDAMPRGGNLTIETHNVTLSADYVAGHPEARPGPHVMLAVSDTGSGMDAATQARIFEPFFTTKGSDKGTGLGLAMVYGIVKQSGGHIQVYSEPGVGTTFKIYLPRHKNGMPLRKSEAGLAPPRLGTETVLLVEDDDSVRRLTRTILENQGYTVLEAKNGGEALLLCEQHPGDIHLLISDVVMPGMSGPQLVERLLRLRPSLRFLYVSGYTDDAIVHHGMLDPETPFLQKPFSAEGLARMVREVLESRVRE